MDSDKLSNEDRAWVNSLYREFQPELTEIVMNKSKGTQKKGIDLWLMNPKPPYKNLSIDEKIRWEDYEDILLEEYSNWERKTPGWTWDTKKINNYVGYIIIPTHRFWILDAPKLRELWNAMYPTWLTRYKQVFGKTKRFGELLYKTSNIPVPIPELSSVTIFTNQ